MSDDLHALEAWAGAPLAKLQPAQRRAINHKVAIDLRRSQAQRIKASREWADQAAEGPPCSPRFTPPNT
ncbi:phage virion morphogenesis protein [Janthinobacterium sp. BJB426]|uniref:phage virion morphogenesis protein n=1 Tax=Janthinobacterium sp. BJB426 TaxID=2048010 RepID=UPI001F41E3AF|nr:phage virion morphogenesis protein [Janthinobacterium sp. BJB426]